MGKNIYDYVIKLIDISIFVSLEWGWKRLNLDRVSVFAEMMVQRATLKRYTKQKVVDRDLLVYYFSLINDQQSYWFPRLYLYADQKVELLERLISRRHFEKVKELFGVNSLKEMVDNMEKLEE